MALDLTQTAALLGVVTGITGTVLGIINHLRDSPRISVNLVFDLVDLKLKEKIGMVTVANLGRRPIFVSHAHLVVPTNESIVVDMLRESLEGKSLSEGDPPVQYIFPQAHLLDTSPLWEKTRAVIRDSTGKLYCSRLPDEYGVFGSLRRYLRCRDKQLYKNRQKKS